MRTYEKPRLVALSLMGNEQLCGSCADQGGLALGKGENPMLNTMIDMAVGNGDGKLTRDDLIGAFGNAEVECVDHMNAYCKFSSQESGITLIAWS